MTHERISLQHQRAVLALGGSNSVGLLRRTLREGVRRWCCILTDLAAIQKGLMYARFE